jgi:hypothetical protein
VRTKAEILTYLKDSIQYARKAADSLNETNQLEPLKTFFGPMPRVGVMAGITFHSYDHYGQMVIYARLNGIVPPTSQPSRN